MSRTPKPWFRQQTGWWMVTLGGKDQKLVKGRENKKLAQQKFHELMLLSAEAPESTDASVASGWIVSASDCTSGCGGDGRAEPACPARASGVGKGIPLGLPSVCLSSLWFRWSNVSSSLAVMPTLL
jgi:hypothetical protein